MFELFAPVPPAGVSFERLKDIRIKSRTHSRYTVRPTAVPIKAALSAVDTIEPASVRRRFAGGSSTWITMSKLQAKSMSEQEKGVRLRYINGSRLHVGGYIQKGASAIWVSDEQDDAPAIISSASSSGARSSMSLYFAGVSR